MHAVALAVAALTLLAMPSAGVAQQVQVAEVQSAAIPDLVEQPVARPVLQKPALTSPALTSEVLSAYIAKQQVLKGFNIFGEAPRPAVAPVLTSEMVSAYAARETDPANAALQAIDNAASAAPSSGLTSSFLADYANDKFVPTIKKVAHANDEKLCLTKAIYYEARGESDNGQWAVANVIINRAMSDRYPTTMCGVIFQNAAVRNGCQFSFACDGRPELGSERQAWIKANRIASAAFSEFQHGQRPGVVPKNALFYHNRTVVPDWSSSYREVAEIGGHLFYSPL